METSPPSTRLNYEPITLSARLNYDPLTRQIVTDHNTPIARDPDIANALPMAEKISHAQSLIERAMAAVNDCPQSLPLVTAIIHQQIPPSIAERITKSSERRKKAKEKSEKRLDSRQTTKDADANAPCGKVINVIRNEQKSGIEIQFDAKPNADDIATLKAKGFHYSIRQKIWYCTYTHDTWAWAQSLMPTSQGAEPVTAPTTPPVVTEKPKTPTTTLPTIDIAALLGR